MKAPEFSRPLEVARVPAKGSFEHMTADARECAGLAQRMKVQAVHAFKARLHVMPWRGGGLKVTGEVEADIEQLSVVSLEPFRSTVTFDVERYFTSRPVSEEDEADPIEHGIVDLGEVAAETFALELDPYPRRPDEAFAGFESVEEPEPKVSPFAALASKPAKKS
jgi:uncharacterized metal-binding protein YceD (DUF177 family)